MITLNTDKLALAISGSPSWIDFFGQKDALSFSSQDSWYRLYRPETKQVEKSFNVKVTLDHIRDAAVDDHAVVLLEFDQTGQLHSVTLERCSLGKNTIPGDKILTVAGGGVGVLLSGEAGAIIVAVTWLANYLYGRLLDDSDDGGRINFPAVVVQNIVRVASFIEVN